MKYKNIFIPIFYITSFIIVFYINFKPIKDHKLINWIKFTSKIIMPS